MSGYIQYAKPVILDEVLRNTQKRIDNLQYRYDSFQKIIPILKKFEGKKVSKRIQTALQEAFPQDHIYLSSIASMEHVEIRGKDMDYNDRVSFLLCYLSDHSDKGIYHEETFIKDRNGDIGNILECIQKLNQGLIEAPKQVERYNQILQEAKALGEDATKVGLEYELDIVYLNR